MSHAKTIRKNKMNKKRLKKFRLGMINLTKNGIEKYFKWQRKEIV